MTRSSIEATFDCGVERVWETVTALDDCSWRGDIDRVEIMDDSHFTEFTPDGYATMFTITHIEPLSRYEFDMENSNISGRWVGLFREEDGRTVVEFTEEVEVKKSLMKPFAKAYLKRQQRRYVADLERALRR